MPSFTFQRNKYIDDMDAMSFKSTDFARTQSVETVAKCPNTYC